MVGGSWPPWTIQRWCFRSKICPQSLKVEKKTLLLLKEGCWALSFVERSWVSHQLSEWLVSLDYLHRWKARTASWESATCTFSGVCVSVCLYVCVCVSVCLCVSVPRWNTTFMRIPVAEIPELSTIPLLDLANARRKRKEKRLSLLRIQTYQTFFLSSLE